MNLAVRMNKRQLLLLVLIIVSLLVTTLIVLHAAMPGLWHATLDVYTPNILNGWH